MTSKPFAVLFVCTANICRSAYAEVRAKALLSAGSRITIASAGTHGHTGEGIDAEMGLRARERGIDASSFVARRVDAALVEAADLILTADSGHRRFLLEEWPWTFRKAFTLGQFADGVSIAPKRLRPDALVDHIREARPAANPANDIADPYRRGPEAAHAAAEQIDRYLHLVLPRLGP